MDERSDPAPFWCRGRLLALSVALPVVEAAAVWAAGVHGAAALAPQASAPAPLAVFHDLRWLLVYNRTWLMFSVALVALVGLRSALTALFVQWSWPGGDRAPTCPSFAEAFRHTVPYTVLALVLLAPWALLLFGMAVVSLSWLFFAAVPPALAVAVLLHHGAVRRGWWRSAPPLRSAGVMGLAILWLMVSAGVLTISPAPLRVVVAGATGVLNAWAWCAVVRAAVIRTEPRRFRPVAPIGVVLILVVVFGGAGLGFSTVTGEQHRDLPDRRAMTKRPVIVVSGFESSWDGRSGTGLGGGFDAVRFSYRGLGPDGGPLAYSGSDTEASLPHLEDLLGTQVRALHRQSGKPVALVAESEGSFIAKSFLIDHPDAPVDLLVMLSPLAHAGSATYPHRGEQGWGLASSYALSGITAAMGALSPFSLSPDTPLLQSLADRGRQFTQLVGCALPGVRQVAIAPVADAVTGPEVPSGAVTVRVVPAFHGGLLGHASVRDQVRRVLHGGGASSGGTWSHAARVFSAATAAWRVPTLADGLRDGAGSASCRSLSRADASPAR